MPDLTTDTALRFLRLTVAFIWLWTAVITTVFSPQMGLDLLQAMGVTGPLARVLMYGACGMEVLVALAVVSGRAVRPLSAFQAALIVGYTVIITASAGLRGLWLHPFAPVAKNIPLLGALAVLYAAGDPVPSGTSRTPGVNP